MSDFHSDRFRAPTRVHVEHAQRSGGRGDRSLACALLFFVPLAPLIGALIGGGALMRPGRRGWRPAAALVLGLLFTAAQGVVGVRGWQFVDRVTHAPATAIASAAHGDFETFRGSFSQNAESTERAERFARVLESRYGRFVAMKPARDGLDMLIALPDQPREYVITFEQGVLRTLVSFEIATKPGLGFLESSMTSMRIIDEKRGTLVWPPPHADPAARRTAIETGSAF